MNTTTKFQTAESRLIRGLEVLGLDDAARQPFIDGLKRSDDEAIAFQIHQAVEVGDCDSSKLYEALDAAQISSDVPQALPGFEVAETLILPGVDTDAWTGAKTLVVEAPESDTERTQTGPKVGVVIAFAIIGGVVAMIIFGFMMSAGIMPDATEPHRWVAFGLAALFGATLAGAIASHITHSSSNSSAQGKEQS